MPRHHTHMLLLTHIIISSSGYYWLRFYIPLVIKYVISETFPKPISCLGMEKNKT